MVEMATQKSFQLVGPLAFMLKAGSSTLRARTRGGLLYSLREFFFSLLIGFFDVRPKLIKAIF
jgi:hypothetical protein